MSIETSVIDSELVIKHLEKALDAIKTYNYTHDYGDISSAKSINDAFNLWGLSLIDKGGNKFRVSSNEDCIGDVSELFEAISPFVEKKSFVRLEFRVEEGVEVIYKFDGKYCKSKSSEVEIDEIYDLVFVYRKTQAFKNCVSKLDGTFEINTSGSFCKVVFNNEFCANIRISKKGEELFKRFQLDQRDALEAKLIEGNIERVKSILKNAEAIILLKLQNLIDPRDYSDDNYNVDWDALNQAERERGVYWKDYLALCEEHGVYCILEDGYYDIEHEGPFSTWAY